MSLEHRALRDKPVGAPPDCHSEREIPGEMDKVALAGTVCHFERAVGGGDPAVRRLAERQHGCVHREQLIAAGLRKDAILRRVAAGWLQRVHSHVFRLGLAWPDRFGPAMAAALQFRGNAVVSGEAAAAVWSLADGAPEVTEVTLVGANARPQPGLRVRRVAHLARPDIRWHRGIPLTAPARTLIDLAARADQLELENALSEALRPGRRLTTTGQIKQAIERAHGRAGGARLQQLIAEVEQHDRDPARTRSLYERKLRQMIASAQLPLPVTNVPVEGLEVDMFWPAHKLVVEFDGYEFHSDRAAFERDRDRDRRLVAAGYRVIRITARQIDHEPFAVIAGIAAALR